MGSGLTWRGLRDRGVGGGGCAQNNEGVFGLQVSPPDSRDDETPRTSFRMLWHGSRGGSRRAIWPGGGPAQNKNGHFGPGCSEQGSPGNNDALAHP